MELNRSGIVVLHYSIATFVSSWWTNNAGIDQNDGRSISIGQPPALHCSKIHCPTFDTAVLCSMQLQASSMISENSCTEPDITAFR
jgi:hypothetical protein